MNKSFKKLILFFLSFLVVISCVLPPTEEEKKGEISVTVNNIIINNGSGELEFDDTDVDTDSTVTFIIKNNGDGDLNLTGSPLVLLTGSSDFTVSTQPSSNSVSASGFTSFVVTFTPSSSGEKTANILIASNDENNGSYSFSIVGNGIAANSGNPEINISVSSTSISSSGSHDVGNAQISTTTNSTTFTIQNTGSSVLNLTGSPLVAVSGTNSSDFTVTQPSSSTVAASGEVTFSVVFNPSSEGSKTATITIVNDDSDEGTYVFTITGTGTTTSSEPEINLQANSTSINSSGSYDVGSAQTSSTSNSTTFTIQNTGTSTLNLTGSPFVVISGTNSSDFTVIQPTSSSVSASGEITFSVVFSPGATGTRTATLTIENNDSDEGTYTFTISGTGTSTPSEPEIDIQVSSTSIASSGSQSFSALELGSTETLTFTILNTGNGDLTLSGSPIVALSGTDSVLFNVTQPATSTVSAGGNTTFTVEYAPVSSTATGSKTATLTINNNDSDEGTYTITLNAEATLTASKLQISGSSSSMDNESTINITVTAQNINDITDTNYTGNVSLSANSGFTLSPTTISISSGGTATLSVTVSQTPLYYETDTTITSSASGLTDATLIITVIPVFSGTELTASDFSNGESIISGTKYIKPREPADAEIVVGGDIVVGAGTVLNIYPGVTLNMGSNTITVEGELNIIGIDDKRVKLTSSSFWNRIETGNSSGTAKLTIDRAYIEKTSSYPIYIGTGSIARGGDVTITNSRIKVDGSQREAIYVYYPKGGSKYKFENNVILTKDQEAFYFASNSDSSITVDINYNTIYGDTSNSSPIAINIVESSSTSIYTIDNNIIAGDFNEALYFSSGNIYVYYRNNVINSGGKYLSTTGNYEESNNLILDGSSQTTDTLNISWDDSTIFTNITLKDFTLKQTDEFPSDAQIINISGDTSTLVGSLTNGHSNEKGAYGNGGNPPNWDD